MVRAEKRPVLKKSALLVLFGRGGGVRFEHALKMALVGKAQIMGNVGDGIASAQTLPRLAYAHIHLISMRRPASVRLKPTHKVIAAHVHLPGHLRHIPVQKIGVLQQGAQTWVGAIGWWCVLPQRWVGQFVQDFVQQRLQCSLFVCQGQIGL